MYLMYLCICIRIRIMIVYCLLYSFLAYLIYYILYTPYYIRYTIYDIRDISYVDNIKYTTYSIQHQISANTYSLLEADGNIADENM